MIDKKIQMKNIKKVYQTKTGPLLAVDNINFMVEEGSIVTLVGPSGCGKSTIIKMLGGIINPTSGEIAYSKNIYKNGVPKEELKELGFIFQSSNLLPWFTVKKNLELPLKVFGLSGEKWNKNIHNLLEMVGLAEYKDAYPNELSDGMKQRIGVIRAMVHNPGILLMDEPFGSLDSITREQLDMELLSIWDKTKKTIVFITHNITEAVLISSRVLVMDTNPGNIVEKININLSRPRKIEMINEEKFVKYVEIITKAIGELDLEKVE